MQIVIQRRIYIALKSTVWFSLKGAGCEIHSVGPDLLKDLGKRLSTKSTRPFKTTRTTNNIKPFNNAKPSNTIRSSNNIKNKINSVLLNNTKRDNNIEHF